MTFILTPWKEKVKLVEEASIEKFMEDEEFRKAAEGARTLGYLKNSLSYSNVCFRVISNPEYEFEKWEEYGGYDPEESLWKRYVCTFNPLLLNILRSGFVPPWLRKESYVMIETKHFLVRPITYSKVARGVVKCLGYEKHTGDSLVSSRDLILAEAYSESKVDIKDIQRIYLIENAPEDIKKIVTDFAKKHNIELVEIPEDPKEALRIISEKSQLYTSDKTVDRIYALADYLDKRSKACSTEYLPINEPETLTRITVLDLPTLALLSIYDFPQYKDKPEAYFEALKGMVKTAIKDPDLTHKVKYACLIPKIE